MNPDPHPHYHPILCPCTLRSSGKCPNGITTLDKAFSCSVWQKFVRPNMYQRIIGTIAAFIGWGGR